MPNGAPNEPNIEVVLAGYFFSSFLAGSGKLKALKANAEFLSLDGSYLGTFAPSNEVLASEAAG